MRGSSVFASKRQRKVLLREQNMRRTSIEAYNYIVSSGKLARKLTEAYTVFYNQGPLTGQELNQRMIGDGAWKLCRPLQRRGVLEEVGEKTCTVTGRSAVVWDVTDRIPVDLPKKKTKKQKAKEILEELNILYSNSKEGNLDHISRIMTMVDQL